MTTIKNRYFNLPLWKRFLFSLVILLSGLSSKALDISQHFYKKSVSENLTYADTIKMVRGVPLKAEDVSPLLSGENIPQVQLINDAGQSFDLNAAVASKPTILIFYRGGWCPYCSKQLAGLQEIEQDLTKMGYQLLAVSTDSPENLKQSEAKSKLSYTLLSDADLAVSKQFGIAFKSPKNYDKFLPETSGGKNEDKLLPVPSVFILNRKGNIRFEYINPNITQRLSPELLKAAASSLIAEL